MTAVATAFGVVGALSTRGDMAVRLLVALGLCWAIGFERELRGSAAGDRTFALVGIGSAVVGYLAVDHAPNALAGVVTGIGFLGAGVILHAGESDGDGSLGGVRGVTTAATIYLAAAVGAAAGQGQLLLATFATAISLLLLEVRHLHVLRFFDGRHWRGELLDDGRADDHGGGSSRPSA
ncbi:MAG: MgtC/SapB family protein [Actinobacteria bacterium]|nr:MgtC/SapB family protein [Actinomycetota bacterium]